MKKISMVLLVGILILAFDCKGKGEKVEEKRKPFVSEGFITVEEGVELRYKTIGNGPQVVVVPLAIYLEYEFERLIDESRTLVFYDQRGRGRSSTVTDQSRLGMDFEISDLEILRSHLDKEKISLIGWSYLGAMVVLYAAQYPDSVDRVIQVGALAPSYEIQKKAASNPMDSGSQTLLKKLKEQGLDEADPEKFCMEYQNIYTKRIFYDPSKISLFRSDRCKCKNEMPDNVVSKINAIFASVGEWDWEARVKDMEVPVLAVHGEKDPSCPIEGARTWTALLRNARFVLVREAGHMPFVENPDLFYSSVDTFLRGEWPDRAEVVGVPVGMKQ